MKRLDTVLAVIPARGGSKGLPGKNLKPFAGLPLIAHTVLFAKMCPGITHSIVSTDSAEIAEVARQFGGDAPFLRPRELAQDDSPLWVVLQHALEQAERQDAIRYDAVLLLDPTSPAREPSDISGALRRLHQHPDADGIIGVSRPDFSPIWHCVMEQHGWMADFHPDASRYTRRQELPVVHRINGSLYLWRSEFVRSRDEQTWRRMGRHLMYEIPDLRAMSIDTAEEFARAELLVTGGLIMLPWLAESRTR